MIWMDGRLMHIFKSSLLHGFTEAYYGLWWATKVLPCHISFCRQGRGSLFSSWVTSMNFLFDVLSFKELWGTPLQQPTAAEGSVLLSTPWIQPGNNRNPESRLAVSLLFEVIEMCKRSTFVEIKMRQPALMEILRTDLSLTFWIY